MKYPKTEPKANFPEIDKKMLEFWRENNTFHNVRDKNKNGKTFRFFDGPATPSSIPHIGHLGISAVKDMICRYRWMRGDNVEHRLGWDVHGLPTEVMVEKATGKQSKELVAELGIEKFCDMCRSGVMKYVGEWERYMARIGRWVDVDDAHTYNTMHRDYMESVIWALKKLYDEGLLYRDFKVNPFDWKLGTVMSNSEASSEYQDVLDDAVTVWFELKNGRRVMAWTTTPWTLPANSALAVNPGLKYAVMKDEDGAEYILAESRVASYEKQFAKAEKVGDIVGAELVGLSYKPLFDYYNDENLYKVISADYVGDDSGTGIVHIAPAFGEDDYLAAKALDPKFPVIVNVDDYGNFTSEVKDFSGENIFVANPKIIALLKENGHLVKKEQYKHSYPYSPRSKEKLIYRATEAWYIDVPKIKDKLLVNNSKVDWKSAGARFLAWIEGARPWGISRNRFWGVPLPIWTNDAGEYKLFASIKEMEEFFDVKIEDLHRPVLDKLEKDGWKRIPDVLDAWFESGSMPFAMKHYPFENSDTVNETDYMADYIIEGQDQTRGWFYTLMVLATALFDRPAFKTVTANGLTVDENKKKMSKSLGNYVETDTMFATYGADALRLFIYGSNFMKAEPVPVDKEGKVFGEVSKNILTPLWNAYHFFTLYANSAKSLATENGFARYDYSVGLDADKYILSELNELIGVVGSALDNYQPDIAIKEFIRFLDLLNNEYIRENRERFWDEEYKAFACLNTIIITLCKLLAPFAPFVSDYIYKNMTTDVENANESVHMCEFPVFVCGNRDTELLNKMHLKQDIVYSARKIREKFKLRNRLPLNELTIIYEDIYGRDFDNLESLFDKIKSELNVKKVVLKKVDIFEMQEKYASVHFQLLFEVLKKNRSENFGEIIDYNKNVAKSPDETKQKYNLGLDEYRYNVKAVPKNGEALPNGKAVIVLDTGLSPELVAEGLANDALRFIQDTRKTIGLDVSDRIVLSYSADPELAEAIETFRERIMTDALVTEMKPGSGEHSTQIEGHPFGLKITKA